MRSLFLYFHLTYIFTLILLLRVFLCFVTCDPDLKAHLHCLIHTTHIVWFFLSRYSPMSGFSCQLLLGYLQELCKVSMCFKERKFGLTVICLYFVHRLIFGNSTMFRELVLIPSLIERVRRHSAERHKDQSLSLPAPSLSLEEGNRFTFRTLVFFGSTLLCTKSTN
jgi:hypothetical protein